MNTNQKRRQQPKTPSYKYSFRLNEEQNIRFNELLCKADWSITETGLAILDNPKIVPKTTLDTVCFYSFRYMCFAR